ADVQGHVERLRDSRTAAGNTRNHSFCSVLADDVEHEAGVLEVSERGEQSITCPVAVPELLELERPRGRGALAVDLDAPSAAGREAPGAEYEPRLFAERDAHSDPPVQ